MRISAIPRLVETKEKEEEQEENEANDLSVSRTDKCMKELRNEVEVLKGNDCNQNIIESDHSVFQQLCTMINDLEQNTQDELVKLNESDNRNIGAKLDDETAALDKKYIYQLIPEKEMKESTSESIYNEMMTFLGSLEDANCNNGLILNKSALDPVKEICEIFSDSYPCLDYDGNVEMTDGTKADLAAARLQIEEISASLAMLKEQLREERKISCEKLDSQKKRYEGRLDSQEKKYCVIVKRHQKFVEQVLREKSELNDKCDALARRMKEMEAKAQRDLKVLADRHSVELRKTKEHCAAAEKIRRERWLETKTTKIKAMTVKGLEPELRNMVEQHQEELQQIRTAHMKELQETELRAIRRMNQNLEQLRIELTASHEKILANEKEILWFRYKEKLDEQEAKMHLLQRKFIEDLDREKSAFQQELIKRDAEKDQSIEQARKQYQREVEVLKERQQLEIKTIRESLKSEWKNWFEKYKRQQSENLENAERVILQDCKKKRDQEIELAIARLEKEARDTRAILQKGFDNKLRCTKERYDAELQSAKDNEETLRTKLELKCEQLTRIENELRETENKLRQCTINLVNSNDLIESAKADRDNARKIARMEIESEKKELEKKITVLYQEINDHHSNKEILLTQIHNRVKLVVSQKMLTIRNLNKEIVDLKSKCQHLEQLLDQQRKEYILRSF
ncbi:centrosomal protein of 131 kDa-like [Prorops nasuta]|uniref:centrosomal protein of 131 kDa-like n=1 Tax=Prorops nasuta TaxID=863751 RepID=UPI0034CE0F35